VRFYFKAEAFNLLNHLLYGNDTNTTTNPTSTRFGMLPIDQQNFPRLIQLSAKVIF
jgi:hypothetical protein